MSFVQQKLDLVSNQTRGIFDTYIYRSDTDNKATIQGAGYFAQSRFINDPDWDGSKIEVVASDGYMEGFVDSNGTFTASLES